MVSKIASATSKIIGAVTKSKAMKKGGNYFYEHPSKAIAYSTIASVVIKDGVGCYKYVEQSLKNDKIPDNKRKFVAALDLTNGVLMIALQLAAFFAIRKVSEPWFNKIMSKSFDKSGNALKSVTTELRMIAKKIGLKTSPRKRSVKNGHSKLYEESLDTFKFFVELAAATIVGKRIAVPLIATPLAGKVEKIMEKHHMGQSKTAKTEEKQPQENNKPEVKPASDKTEFTNKLDIKEGNSSNLLSKYKQAS